MPPALPLRAAEDAEDRRTRPEQEPKVVPVAASLEVVDGELVPAAKGMHDQHDPGRKTVPEPPERVFPPHGPSLLPVMLSVSEASRNSMQERSSIATDSWWAG